MPRERFHELSGSHKWQKAYESSRSLSVFHIFPLSCLSIEDAWLNELADQRNLGMSMRPERATLEQVKAKLASKRHRPEEEGMSL
jgi:hypothetical protein